jgi:hypothetical protein
LGHPFPKGERGATGWLNDASVPEYSLSRGGYAIYGELEGAALEITGIKKSLPEPGQTIVSFRWQVIDKTDVVVLAE